MPETVIQHFRDLVLTIIRSLKDLKIDKAERDQIRNEAEDLLQLLMDKFHSNDKPTEEVKEKFIRLQAKITEAEKKTTPIAPTVAVPTMVVAEELPAPAPTTTPTTPTAVATTVSSTPSPAPPVPSTPPVRPSVLKTSIVNLWNSITRGVRGIFAMGVVGWLGTLAAAIVLVLVVGNLLGNIGKPWRGTFSSSVSASSSSSSFTRGMGKKAEDVFVTNAESQRNMGVIEQTNNHDMGWRDQDQEDTAEAHRYAWLMELAKAGMSVITLYNPAGSQIPLTVTILGKFYSIAPGHTKEIPAPLGDHRGVKNGRTATFPVTPPSARTATDGAVITTGCLCDDSPMP